MQNLLCFINADNSQKFQQECVIQFLLIFKQKFLFGIEFSFRVAVASFISDLNSSVVYFIKTAVDSSKATLTNLFEFLVFCLYINE